MASIRTYSPRGVAACLTALLALAGLAASLPAQNTPEQPQPDRNGTQPSPKDSRPGRPAGAPDGKMLKDRLQTRLDELDQFRDSLRDAIAKLDKGSAPGEVMRDLAPAMRAAFRGEGGGRPEDGEETNMPFPPRRGGAPDGPEGDGGGPPGEGVRGEGGMGEPDRPGRNGPPGRQGAGSPEDREKLLDQLRQHAPELAKRLEAMGRNEPGMAMRFGGKLMPRVREALMQRESRPELFKLKMRELTNAAVVFESVRSYRDASRRNPVDDSRLKESEAALRTALTEQYDVRRDILTLEVDDLAKHLEQMRSDLNRHQGDRDKAVDGLMQKVREGKELRELNPQGGPGGPGGPQRPRP